MFGSQLTNWSVRIALLLYLLATCREICNGRQDRVARYAWLAGAIAFLAHVAAAFSFHHDMSHRAAFENTAERTREMLGFAFGGGIYFSYLFTAMWTADAVWRVTSPTSYSTRAGWLHYSVHGYLFFIALNGAAVFENGLTRWGGLVGCALLAGFAVRRWKQNCESVDSSRSEASVS